ncbi:MAG: hypothetical protein KBE09_03545 [Candidatus Pacebacteria bacterium]|nr:hypothetical protein [Candidatus Paceibacterota bacterium]
MKRVHARYLGVFMALAMMTYALSMASPQALVSTAGQLLANATVGMQAGVLPNQYNALAQALSEKEAELAAREQQLSGVEVRRGMFSTNTMAVASFGVSVLLLVLVGLNFYFDVRRARRASLASRDGAIDLRAQH